MTSSGMTNLFHGAARATLFVGRAGFGEVGTSDWLTRDKRKIRESGESHSTSRGWSRSAGGDMALADEPSRLCQMR